MLQFRPLKKLVAPVHARKGDVCTIWNPMYQGDINISSQYNISSSNMCVSSTRLFKTRPRVRTAALAVISQTRSDWYVIVVSSDASSGFDNRLDRSDTSSASLAGGGMSLDALGSDQAALCIPFICSDNDWRWSCSCELKAVRAFSTTCCWSLSIWASRRDVFLIYEGV